MFGLLQILQEIAEQNRTRRVVTFVLRFIVATLMCAASVYGFDTEESVRKSVPVSSANHLKLNADFGSIAVLPGAGKRVDVEVFLRGDPPSRREFDRMLHDFSLKVTQQGSEIGVEATFTQGWEPLLSFMLDGGLFSSHQICHNWRCLVYSSWLEEVEFRIAVPAQFDANVATAGGSISVSRLKGAVIAHTSGGSLRFDRIDGPVNGSTSGGGISVVRATGRTVVHTSGGPISITDTTGDVDASTSGGPISLSTVSGRVKAHTSGGWIDAKEISGAVDVSTSGGSVTASIVAQPRQDCSFSTSGGSINLSLPKDARVNLDASTSGGSVSTDFPVPYTDDRHHSELRAPLNGGGPLLHLHTSGGSIHVRSAGAL
jgi:Putative adhesin